MEKCTIGEKCYFNSFAGFIKCKVIDITDDNLIIEITAKNNRVYPKGSIVKMGKNNVIPRKFCHNIQPFRFTVYPDYVWMKGDN